MAPPRASPQPMPRPRHRSMPLPRRYADRRPLAAGQLSQGTVAAASLAIILRAPFLCSADATQATSSPLSAPRAVFVVWSERSNRLGWQWARVRPAAQGFPLRAECPRHAPSREHYMPKKSACASSRPSATSSPSARRRGTRAPAFSLSMLHNGRRSALRRRKHIWGCGSARPKSRAVGGPVDLGRRRSSPPRSQRRCTPRGPPRSSGTSRRSSPAGAR